MSKKVNAAKTAAKTTAKKQREFVTVTFGSEYWKPEGEGDNIEGTFVEILTRKMIETSGKDKGKEKEIETVYIVNDEDKQIGLPSTFAINQFGHTLKKGDYIRITFEGKKKIKGGKSVNNYKFEKAN